MKKTLLIMAAGLASRYGGSKQTDALGPDGELLMDYSIDYARAAGFEHTVVVVSESMSEQFRQTLLERHGDMKMDFAVQSFASLPEWFSLPEERTKPYGTVHAVLSARRFIGNAFAVVNADDYYGREAFCDMAAALERLEDNSRACMITYRIDRTLSGHGKVTRGIARDRDGRLLSLEETYNVSREADGKIYGERGGERVEIPAEAYASMNFFGFLPAFFDYAQESFEDFLFSLPANSLKSELAIPVLLDELITADKLLVEVIRTDSEWFGVTFREDRDEVIKRLSEISEQ